MLAYLRRVLVRSSIGGYVKSVLVEEVIASGDVCWIAVGSSSELSVSLKMVSILGG